MATMLQPEQVLSEHRSASTDTAHAPTRASTLIEGSVAHVMRVIADVSAYPRWVQGIRWADVLTWTRSGHPSKVRMLVGPAGDADERIYSYRWPSVREVAWSLDSSKSLRSLNAAFLLTPIASQRTLVTYQLSLETKLQLVGPLRRRAELVMINRMLPGLKNRVEQTAAIPAARRPMD